MATKQEQRSEETKKNIVAAAGRLFASRGYDTVTMREIAKEAGCSHTTIYIYFKDKEALLQQLATPPLQQLNERMDSLLVRSELAANDKLLSLSMMFIEFCLVNRSMYGVFFAVKSVRVDEQAPELAINVLRNTLFGKLSNVLRDSLPDSNDEQQLQNARIFFYMLHGLVATYTDSDESAEELMSRLEPTFLHAIEVVHTGLMQRG